MTPGGRIAVIVGALVVGTLIWAPHGEGFAGRRARTVVNARGVPADPAPIVDLPIPTTTTSTAPVAVSAPQAIPAVRPDVPAPAVPTTLIPPAVLVRTAPPGHYACTGDDSATAECVNDETGADVTPATGDSPAPIDPAYAARLTADLCAARPEFCS